MQVVIGISFVMYLNSSILVHKFDLFQTIVQNVLDCDMKQIQIKGTLSIV